MPDSPSINSPTLDIPRVVLRESHIQFNYSKMRASHRARWNEWLSNYEQFTPDRTFHLPRIHEMYARAKISEDQRAALHVTRKVIEAVTQHSFENNEGLFAAQFSDVTKTITALVWDSLTHQPQTPGEKSLAACMVLLRENSYNISEGPSFIRTPHVLPKLEQKYYVDDLRNF